MPKWFTMVLLAMDVSNLRLLVFVSSARHAMTTIFVNPAKPRTFTLLIILWSSSKLRKCAMVVVMGTVDMGTLCTSFFVTHFAQPSPTDCFQEDRTMGGTSALVGVRRVLWVMLSKKFSKPSKFKLMVSLVPRPKKL